MKSTLIAFRQCPNSWRKMLLLGLLALAALNPPAFLLAQRRPVKFAHLARAGAFANLSRSERLEPLKGGF